MRFASNVQTLDDSLQDHLDALGFARVGSYRVWCHKQGFRSALDKSPEEMEAELRRRRKEQEQPQLSPDFKPGDLRAIEQGYRGTGSEWARRPFEDAVDDAEREAIYRVLKHMTMYGTFKRGRKHSPGSPGQALASLARHHREWLHPVEEWFPSRRKGIHEFTELSRFLLAKYPVPRFMDAAFFEREDRGAADQQEWFKHIGRGQNIRRANTPIRLTKRMAHLFQDAPGHYTVSMAMRWAQFLGMDGNLEQARSILGTRLRWFQDDEPFWATVLLFIANQPLLEPENIGPIVDYIHHQKYVPQEVPGPDGQPMEIEPAQPNFSMKGRSIHRLLDRVDGWHGEVSLARKNREVVRWESSRLKSFEHVEEDEVYGDTLHWTVRELCDSWELMKEGEILMHCIPTYEKRCVRGDYSVWSVQVEETNKLRKVLTIAVKSDRKLVTEYRGKYNMMPNGKVRTANQQRSGRSYMYLLRKSPEIMNMWMDHNGITRNW